MPNFWNQIHTQESRKIIADLKNTVILFRCFSYSILQLILDLYFLYQSIINPILIRVYPHKEGWPDLPHSNSNLSNYHSPSQFMVSSFSKPIPLLSSTCIFYVFFGRPCFLLLFTSNSNAFLKTCPSSLLNKCKHHLLLY